MRCERCTRVWLKAEAAGPSRPHPSAPSASVGSTANAGPRRYDVGRRAGTDHDEAVGGDTRDLSGGCSERPRKAGREQHPERDSRSGGGGIGHECLKARDNVAVAGIQRSRSSLSISKCSSIAWKTRWSRAPLAVGYPARVREPLGPLLVLLKGAHDQSLRPTMTAKRPARSTA